MIEDEEWLSFSDLCERWGKNKPTVAKLVIDGKLRAHNKEYQEIMVTGDGTYIESLDGFLESYKLSTVNDVVEFIFSPSDVAEFERENGIIPHVLPPIGHRLATPEPTEETDAEYSEAWDKAVRKSAIIDEVRCLELQKPRDITERNLKRDELKELEGKLAKIDGDKCEEDQGDAIEPTGTITPTVSTISNKGGDKFYTPPEEDVEAFIRSLQVSYVCDTEVSIKADKQRAKTYSYQHLGFARENTKSWGAFINILKSSDHSYHVGAAYGAGKVRNKPYDANRRILAEISKKLISLLKEYYNIQLPDRFQLFELRKGDRAGTYGPKFIVSNFNIGYDPQVDMSRDTLIKEIEKLSALKAELCHRGDQDSEEKLSRITEKLEGK